MSDRMSVATEGQERHFVRVPNSLHAKTQPRWYVERAETSPSTASAELCTTTTHANRLIAFNFHPPRAVSRYLGALPSPLQTKPTARRYPNIHIPHGSVRTHSSHHVPASPPFYLDEERSLGR